jgi:hypothetical protein
MGGHTIRPAARDWLALSDGIGHSQTRFGRERAACDAQRIDPRFAHPIRERCPGCLDKVGVQVQARVPWTESELRAAHGDR